MDWLRKQKAFASIGKNDTGFTEIYLFFENELRDYLQIYDFFQQSGIVAGK